LVFDLLFREFRTDGYVLPGSVGLLLGGGKTGKKKERRAYLEEVCRSVLA